jgi:CAAX protease family protein
MNSLIAVILAHLLAASIILVAPWLGHLQYQKARKRLQAGDPRVRTRLYRNLVAEQVVTTSIISGLCLFGGIPRTGLGICAPRSWWLTVGLAAIIVALLVRSALRVRPKAQKLRAKLQDTVGALLPGSLEEQRWFAAVSIGAGISEELAIRGFLFYYLGLYVPHINNLEKALLTSLIFGLAHLYQGWKGVAKTGLGGLFLAALYLLSGSLLLPMVVHVMMDMQVPLIFWPEATPNLAAQEGT